MFSKSDNKFQTKLLAFITIISFIVIFRLGLAALESENWQGFWISSVHVLIVAIGSFLALKRSAE